MGLSLSRYRCHMLIDILLSHKDFSEEKHYCSGYHAYKPCLLLSLKRPYKNSYWERGCDHGKMFGPPQHRGFVVGCVVSSH